MNGFENRTDAARAYDIPPCGVAQSVEQGAVSTTVAGSSPAPAAQSAADWTAAIARNKRPKFTIERASIAAFYEVHQEYKLFLLPRYKAPRVLDLGANYGVFSWSVCLQWPDATVIAYEAHPDTARDLRNNMEGLPVDVHHAAITGDGRAVKLYEGARNRLCCSVRTDLNDQDLECGWEVPGVSAKDLPACDILKCDVEGLEVEILESYPHMATLRALLVECHTELDMRKVAAIAGAAGLTLLSQESNTLRFCR